jgi:hypothetical protein
MAIRRKKGIEEDGLAVYVKEKQGNKIFRDHNVALCLLGIL